MDPSESHYQRHIRAPYKSWGEQQIARLLARNDIAFQYEYPLAVVDRGKVRLYYPDFRLPEYGLIIEYFGVNGKPTYDEQVRHKIRVYEQAEIEGLFLTRQSLTGDWPTTIMGQIEEMLETRIQKFRSIRAAHSVKKEVRACQGPPCISQETKQDF